MKQRFMIVLISCLVLLLAGCNSNDKDSPKETNPEYTTFLEDHNLPDVDFMKSFLSLHEIKYTNSFITEDADGIITVQQLAASEDGTVCIDAYTLYYPVSDYTPEEREALDTSIRYSFSEIESFDFASISSAIGEEYYEITVCLHHLNEYDNYLAAAEAGYYETIPEKDTLLSYESFTDSLTEEGYITKYLK
jgi:hypothetical protein